MRVFRRVMLGSGLDINSIPDSNKLCYTATQEVIPKEGSLGSKILLSSYNEVTKEGTIYTLNPITTIGEDAFYENNYITSIIIPPSVKKINKSAFEDTSNLSELTLLDGGIEFGSYVFTRSGIKKVIIGINPSDKGYTSCLDLIASNTGYNIGSSPFFYNRASLYDEYGNIVKNGTIERSSIGNYAFAGIDNIESLLIAPYRNILNIGEGAFYKVSSEFIVNLIGHGEVNIGKEAFAYSNICELYSASDIPVHVRLSAFSKSKITKISSNIVEFENYAFEDCIYLKYITIPKDVISISSIALKGTMFSKTLLMNYSNLDAEANNYWGATMYELITDDGLCINNSVVEAYKPHSKDVVIPDDIVSISERLFEDNSKIKTLTIGNGITEIPINMCSNCSSLTSVMIGDNVVNINKNAFRYCSNLCDVVIPNSVTSINNFSFEDCKSLQHIILPENLVSIGYMAFKGSALESIVIPDSVTFIDDGAFDDCLSLSSVHIGHGLTEISTGVFNTTGLTEVFIPDNITSIGQASFKYIETLEKVTIGKNVSKILSVAFGDCNKLKDVYCKALNPPICSSDTFQNINPGFMIYVPVESVDAYKSATNWSAYADYIIGYDFETNTSVE